MNSECSLGIFYSPEVRQYKNDVALTKNRLGLNLPRFSVRRIGDLKSVANSKLAYSTSKWNRSFIVFALVICRFLYFLLPIAVTMISLRGL